MAAKRGSEGRGGKWGRINLDYDSDEARDEAAKLRSEFESAMQLMQTDPNWPTSRPQEDPEGEMPPMPASARHEASRSERRDVLGDGRLLKKSLRTRASGGGQARVRWGDVATCRFSARAASRGAPFARAASAAFAAGWHTPRGLHCHVSPLAESFESH